MLRRRWSAPLALVATLTCAPAAHAVEPWADPDPAEPPSRTAFGDYGVKAGAEYRANWLYVNPISLNTTSQRRVNWVEHRLRLDGAVDYQDKIRLIASADVLDGVLWGDNGTFTQTPSSDRGSNVAARNPNLTTPCMTLQGGDPLKATSYGYGLCEAEPFKMRRLYGEVVTPVGLLRIGRQPVTLGLGVQASTGDGRTNRFGFARQGNSVDRILFATKPLEGFKPKEQRDLSANSGFFFITSYERYVTDKVQLFGDDVHQATMALRYAAPTFSVGSDLDALVYGAHRWDQQYGTSINAVGARAMARFGGFYAGFEVAYNHGSTREVGEAYRLIANDPVIDQPIRQLGARAVLRYDYAPWAYGTVRDTTSPASKGSAVDPLWTAYVEFDYASGDPDPQNRTPLTQFVWAEDTNVGLLLFKHVLAFQSARSAAAAVETLRRLGATSFPAESIDTRGSFTNAIAIFPQLDVRPHPNVLLRGGVLLAWADAPVIDPVASLQARDGLTITDDLVNFVGGKPARRYGTELDGRFQWRYLDHFLFDLEGAVLFPGDALKDRDGRAVRATMVQGRTTFVF